MNKRIIPIFLLKNERLYKGENFSNHIDVGNVYSQAKIYDSQGADEIVILDITASNENRLINTETIKKVVDICRLPIAVGGGIKSVEDARKCFLAGADKIVINSSAVKNTELIKELSDEFGSQAIVLSVDVLKENNNYSIYTNSGKIKSDIDLKYFLKKVIKFGVGEIILTSINHEGKLNGFDLDLYKELKDIINVPLIASGGAGTYDHIVDILSFDNVDACSIGKMLFLRDYDIVRIKSYLKGKKIKVRNA
jgi:cyclase